MFANTGNESDSDSSCSLYDDEGSENNHGLRMAYKVPEEKFIFPVSTYSSK